MAINIDLMGKTAVVTGAGRGIGSAVARRLARAGARVVLVSRTKAQIEDIAEVIRTEGGEALVVATDVTRQQNVTDLMARAHDWYNGIHILVNNVGIMLPGALLDYPEEHWDNVMAVNLKSVFLCTQAVGRYMVKQKWGRIINMASTGGEVAGPANASYHASKAGIILFTKSVAMEWIRHGINVNAVGPGFVDTEMADTFIGHGTREQCVRMIPIRRFAEPDEVADVVVFLASDLARYMVGEHVIVDGGLTIP